MSKSQVQTTLLDDLIFASSMLGIPPVGAIHCAHGIKHLAGTETSASYISAECTYQGGIDSVRPISV